MSTIEATEYTISPYRYAKNSVVVRTVADGWKTRACRLAGSFGRFVGRAGGYVMTVSASEKFCRLYAAGWDGDYFSRKRHAPSLSHE